MFYKNDLLSDLKALMRICVDLELRQIRRYYSPILKKPTEIDPYIKILVSNGFLREIGTTDNRIYHWRYAPMVETDKMKRAIECFWVIANFGCDKVDAIHYGNFPTTFTFLLKQDDDVITCDVSCVLMVSEAMYVKNNRTVSLPKNGEDIITHIAVFKDNDKEFIKDVGDIGIFDIWTFFPPTDKTLRIYDFD